LPPRDLLLSSGIPGVGYRTATAAERKAVVTNYDVNWPEPVGFNAVREVSDVVIVSANHAKSASGLAAKLTFLEETDPETIHDAVRKARGENRLAVGLTTMQGDQISRYFPEDAMPQ